MDPIVGTWTCKVPPAGGFPGFDVVKNFQVGGTIVEMDNAGPSSQETATLGNWKHTGKLTYGLVLQQFTYDLSGNFAGAYHITQPLTLDESLTTLEGSFQFDLVDANGNVLASGSGTVSCGRL